MHRSLSLSSKNSTPLGLSAYVSNNRPQAYKLLSDQRDVLNHGEPRLCNAIRGGIFILELTYAPDRVGGEVVNGREKRLRQLADADDCK